jgi:hypothetical protein
MQCQQNGESTTHPGRDADPSDPDPNLQPHAHGSGGRRVPGLVLSALVTVLGLWTVGSAVGTPVSGAAAVAVAAFGLAVAVAGGYNTVRQAIDIRPSITADVAIVSCGLCLVLTTLTLEPIFWSGLLRGTVVAGLAGYNGYRTRENRTISGGSASGG